MKTIEFNEQITVSMEWKGYGLFRVDAFNGKHHISLTDDSCSLLYDQLDEAKENEDVMAQCHASINALFVQHGYDGIEEAFASLDEER